MSEFTSCSSFEELEIGQTFSYLEQKWVKMNNVRATRVEDGFSWLFPGGTIVDIEASIELLDSDEGEN